MAIQTSFQAPCVKMDKLENLWLQLSTVACNLKCKHCYLSCSPNNKKRNFIPLDKVKAALEEARSLNLKMIYLNGGEPLLHSDFNNILRMCLKITNVTILTNATLINDKKARFLKQIENEHNNELIFRISIDHYSEEKNDEIRGKGSYKKAVSGVLNLVNYGFNPIISVANLWNEDEKLIKSKFSEMFLKMDFETEDLNYKIHPCNKLGEYGKNYNKYLETEIVQQQDVQDVDFSKFDCSNSRVITANGVYSCPILVADPRGKVGNTLADCVNRVYLETPACYTCTKHHGKMLCNDF